VTSRADGDDDDQDDSITQETQPAGIMTTAPRRTSRKPAQADAVSPSPANGNGSNRTVRGAAATGDTPAGAVAANGVKDKLLTTGTTETVTPASVEDADAEDASAEETSAQETSAQETSAQETSADATSIDAIPAVPADTSEPSPAADPAPSSSPPPVSPASSSATPSGTETPTVSPAAFAWDMPDPPPDSPSSPARSFLRSGTSTRNTSTRDQTATKASTATVPPAKATSGDVPVPSRGSQRKASKRSARQAHLTVARVEPWSVMKFSFVLSLVAFVILFVAVAVLYGALAGLGVFDSLQRVVTSVTSSQSSTGVNAAKWWSASRVLDYTALLGLLNIVLITAMSTIGAVVYNLTSRLVGGVEVTLRETE
jgi:hypothetical protein